ncbi:hypothetical protein NDU88_004289 [Pleurodeles waltl]|uniref:Uncharacterized protein n=1 Tax=Pleurodeles waltl TaxID=8319 RepID=A0AAV7V2K7_PLEWA|nr:hypothetical protein NDU88_004289 [Pleurodeles waltl]
MAQQRYRNTSAVPTAVDTTTFRERTNSEDNLYLAVLRATEGKKACVGVPQVCLSAPACPWKCKPAALRVCENTARYVLLAVCDA